MAQDVYLDIYPAAEWTAALSGKLPVLADPAIYLAAIFGSLRVLLGTG